MHRLFISVLTVLLALPTFAFAEAPPYVTGLSAEVINGEVHLEWAQQPGADVAYYRIYYSFESILENEGLYDDFEETEGSENFYVFEDPPEVAILYLAVIGVSPDGEDADLFVEEIAVNLTQDSSTPTVPPSTPDPDFPEDDFPPWDFEDDFPPDEPIVSVPGDNDVLTVKDESFTLPGQETPQKPPSTPQQVPGLPSQQPVQTQTQPPKSTTLKVLLAIATSPTQLTVTFSGPILVEPEFAPQAFSVRDANGVNLPIIQMVIEGPEAVITTQEQARGQAYEFRVSPPAYSPEGLELDTTARRAFFSGHAQGTAQQTPTQTQPVTTQGPLQGVANYKLQAVPQPNGLFTVTATWNVVGNLQELAYYIAYQTRDGGQTFGEPEPLTANISGIQIPNVTPGPFGLMLAMARIDGMGIPAGFENIMLGGQVQQLPAQVMPPAQAPPTPSYPTRTQPTRPEPAPTPPSMDKLAQTGPMVAVLLLGAAGGMIVAGRRKRVSRKFV